MTSTDQPLGDMIEQLTDLLGGTKLAAKQATAAVKAGWRPPPSGDVIEAAQGTMLRLWYQLAEEGTRDSPEGFVARDVKALADAGLLRTPGESVSIPVPPPVDRLRAAGEGQPEPWKCKRCGSDRWIGWRNAPAHTGAPRRAQCVPCGHVQDLPGGEDPHG